MFVLSGDSFESDGVKAFRDGVSKARKALVAASSAQGSSANVSELATWFNASTFGLVSSTGLTSPATPPPEGGKAGDIPPIGQIGQSLHADLNAHSHIPIRAYATITQLTFLPVYPKCFANPFPSSEASKDKEDEQKLEIKALFETNKLGSFEDYTHEKDEQEFLEKLISEVNTKGGGYLGTASILHHSKPFQANQGIVKSLFDKLEIALCNPQKSCNVKTKNDQLTNLSKDSAVSQYTGRRHRYFFDVDEDLASGRASTTYYYHGTWAHHTSGYSTLRFVEEADDAKSSVIPEGSSLTHIPTLVSGANGKVPLLPTALDRQKSIDWNVDWFGRYIQGATYVVVPIAEVMGYEASPDRSSQCCNFLDFMASGETREPDKPQISLEGGAVWELDQISKSFQDFDPRDAILVSLLQRGAGLCPTSRMVLDQLIDAAEEEERRIPRLIARCNAEIRVNIIRALCASAANTPQLRALVDTFILRLMRPVMHRMFGLQKTEVTTLELVASTIRNREAYCSSNIRLDPRAKAWGGDLFTATLVLDINLNDYVRGRVISNLADFSSERIFPLTVMPIMRLIHQGLSNVEADLSRSLANWTKSLANKTSSISEPSKIQHEFLKEIRGHIAHLDYINRLVPNGIDFWARTNESARLRLQERLNTLNETPVQGFLSLRDFITQRMDKASSTIHRASKRNIQIREQINQYLIQIDAEAEVDLGEEQKSVLEKLDRLTNFGITYYFGYVIATVVMGGLILWKYPGADPKKDPAAPPSSQSAAAAPISSGTAAGQSGNAVSGEAEPQAKPKVPTNQVGTNGVAVPASVSDQPNQDDKVTASYAAAAQIKSDQESEGQSTADKVEKIKKFEKVAMGLAFLFTFIVAFVIIPLNGKQKKRQLEKGEQKRLANGKNSTQIFSMNDVILASVSGLLIIAIVAFVLVGVLHL